MRYAVSIGQSTYDVELNLFDGRWHCRLNGREMSVDCAQINPGRLSMIVDGKSFAVRDEPGGHVWVGSHRYEVSIVDPRSWQSRKRRELGQSGPQRLTASMPGKVVRVLTHEGEKVDAGQGIIVIEAMKMQNEIKSPKSGTLRKLLVHEGKNVNAGEGLAVVE